MSTTHRRSPARRVLWTSFYSRCDARRATAPHKILPSSFEVIQIYPTCSLRVVRVGGVFWRFLSGKNFFIGSVIMRAFSKFCRLIVSINFPFRSAAPPSRYRYTILPKQGGIRPLSCYAGGSVVVREDGQAVDRLIMPDLGELSCDGMGADAQLWLQA